MSEEVVVEENEMIEFILDRLHENRIYISKEKVRAVLNIEMEYLRKIGLIQDVR